MDFGLQDRVVIIAGTGYGIGRAGGPRCDIIAPSRSE